jgi:hypothetical protein
MFEIRHDLMLEYKKFEYLVCIKADLLAKGIRLNQNVGKRKDFNRKQIHLYQHCAPLHPVDIPEDLVLYSGNDLIPEIIMTKFRYNPDSDWYLDDENGYKLRNERKGVEIPVEPTPQTGFDQYFIGELPLSSIVQKLGTDVAGVVLSNWCLYFQNNHECRFCEIFPTDQSQKTFHNIQKSIEQVVEGLKIAFQVDSHLKHVLITSGNLTSYDHTVREYIKIGEGIKELKKKNINFQAILMPPENFLLMDEMRNVGFQRVCMNLDVFDPQLFEIITPGKAAYGYQRLFNALGYASKVFDVAYSSIVYGIQSLSLDLDVSKWDPAKENQKALAGIDGLLEKNIIPLFSVYHSCERNAIGLIRIDGEALFAFTSEYGQKVFSSGIIAESQNSISFDSTSLNGLINDGYYLAKYKKEIADLETFCINDEK